MKYMEVDLQRKRQMAQLAKHKYQRMMEVRHQSFIEKKELTKVLPPPPRNASSRTTATS